MLGPRATGTGTRMAEVTTQHLILGSSIRTTDVRIIGMKPVLQFLSYIIFDTTDEQMESL